MLELSGTYADVSELADELVLETSAIACRFKSCHPHQKRYYPFRVMPFFDMGGLEPQGGWRR